MFLPIKVEGSSSVFQPYVDDLAVYPNPSNGLFTIQFTSYINQKIELYIYSSAGEIVFNERLNNFEDSYSNIISLGNQPKGGYFLELNTNSGSINKKIVLQ